MSAVSSRLPNFHICLWKKKILTRKLQIQHFCQQQNYIKLNQIYFLLAANGLNTIFTLQKIVYLCFQIRNFLYPAIISLNFYSVKKNNFPFELDMTWLSNTGDLYRNLEKWNIPQRISMSLIGSSLNLSFSLLGLMLKSVR